jgi:hypothetical protein
LPSVSAALEAMRDVLHGVPRMPRPPVNPALLKGEALNRWYLRTPDEVEAERRGVEEGRYKDFFGSPEVTKPEPQPPRIRTVAADPDVLWVAKGSGGYRAVRPTRSYFPPDPKGAHPDYLPDNAAAPEYGAFTEVGNPHNPRLRREWEAANGRPWPRTKDGRAYHVSHRKAIADGGTNTLDNIEPMDPEEHIAKHKRDGDNERFGKRSAIARAFGGTVEPPAHAPRRPRGPKLRAVGPLGWAQNLLGILNGDVRTDTQTHFWNDMLGYSSEDDLPREDLIA